MSNWDTIQRAIESKGATLKKSGDVWRGNSPLRTGSDSNGFAIKPDIDGRDGVFKDHVSGESGNFYELAEKLQIELEDSKPTQVQSTRRVYTSLEDYAKAHGVTVDVFQKAGWEQVTHVNRPAIKFPTATGNRYRFIDGFATGDKPLYMHDKGTTTCFYGLKKAIAIAKEDGYQSLVFCNGEASTVVAQHYGIPAFSQTSGEKPLQNALLDELEDSWNGRILIALDCDDTGRNVAQKIQQQVKKGVIIDIGLSEHGDLADLCMLHQNETYPLLLNLAQRQSATQNNQQPEVNPHMTDAQTDRAASREVKAQLYGEADLTARPFLHPLKSLHKFGGYNRISVTGKVTLIIGGTGTGKTQLLETMTDTLCRAGQFGMWCGEEWNKHEMHERRIQRYSYEPHLTTDDLYLHKIWLTGHKNGVHPDDNLGVKLTNEQFIAFNRADTFINHWTGGMDYAERHTSINDVFEDMAVTIERRKRNGQIVDFAVFDYVQLLRASSPERTINQYEYAFDRVKQFSSDFDIHIYMTSQANKLSQDDIEKGKLLGLMDAHWVRGDKANSALTLNRVYVPHNDEYRKTPCFWLRSVKSSLINSEYSEDDAKVPLLMAGDLLMFKETYIPMGGKTLVDWTHDPRWAHVPGNVQYSANHF